MFVVGTGQAIDGKFVVMLVENVEEAETLLAKKRDIGLLEELA
jgi:hypothetical protein